MRRLGLMSLRWVPRCGKVESVSQYATIASVYRAAPAGEPCPEMYSRIATKSSSACGAKTTV
jgi:hypothetical protein